MDVDFTQLKALAEGAGLSASDVIPQGAFLMALGAEARMQQLVKAHPARGDEIHAAAASLIDPAQMGSRFKAICLSSPDLPVAAGFTE